MTGSHHSGTLVQLVEAITTLQDMDLGELTVEPFDPSELAGTAVQLAHQRAVRAGVILCVDCATDIPTIAGDFIWLSQALYQLLDNAIKVTVRLRKERYEDSLQISVEDQGIGIPAEEQRQVFELFYQADETTTRRFGGTGLGLAIVQHVVQAHGGQV
jgi:signal transduction histidine kinase